MAYTIETILAEKYETIIRRNIGTTRARDYYDLYTLFRRYKDTICIDILKSAVLHTAEKRTSMDDIREWEEILTDIHDLNQKIAELEKENLFLKKAEAFFAKEINS